MSQLASEHHNLPTVMAFMCDEIGEKVADVLGGGCARRTSRGSEYCRRGRMRA